MGSLLYLPIALAIATCWLLVLTTIMTPISDISQQLKVILIIDYNPFLFLNFSYFIYVYQDSLHFPTSLQELKEIANLLSQFQVHHPGYVMLLFASAYLYKQTFAIPGSVFLVYQNTINYLSFQNKDTNLSSLEFAGWCSIWPLDRDIHLLCSNLFGGNNVLLAFQNDRGWFCPQFLGGEDKQVETASNMIRKCFIGNFKTTIFRTSLDWRK